MPEGGCFSVKQTNKQTNQPPNQTKPNQAKPNQTKPNQTKPNQTKPNQPTNQPTNKQTNEQTNKHPRAILAKGDWTADEKVQGFVWWMDI